MIHAPVERVTTPFVSSQNCYQTGCVD